MGYSKAHVEATRAKIVSTANRLFRQQGYERTSIDQIMEKSGLTRGGFYAHFKSKADLFAQAMKTDLNFTLAVETQRANNPKDETAALSDALAYYLDRRNVNRVGNACTLVTLTPEIARMGTAARSGFTESLEQLLGSFTEVMGDRQKAMQAIQVSVGALLLARTVSCPSLREELLESGRLQAQALAAT